MDQVFIVVVCLLFNAFLAAYEMAFVSVPRSELRALVKQGNKLALRLLQLRENPERTLSIIQIGITLVGAIAAAVGGSGAGETLEPLLIARYGFSEAAAEALSLTMVVIPITYLSVVIGELVPKTLALRNPIKVVLGGAKLLFLADRFFSPVITVLELSTQFLLKTFFPRSKKENSNEGLTIELHEFSPVHQKFMLNMADIEKRQIKDIMLPITQVVFAHLKAPINEVLNVVLSSGHTRLPVRFNDTIVGVLHTKEFISLKELGETEWQKIIRPNITVKTSDSALGVMRLLQEKKNHMAMVIQATGQVVGIVTLEDILEEIIGDIFDEDDDGRIRKVYTAKIRSKTLTK